MTFVFMFLCFTYFFGVFEETFWKWSKSRRKKMFSLQIYTIYVWIFCILMDYFCMQFSKWISKYDFFLEQMFVFVCIVSIFAILSQKYRFKSSSRSVIFNCSQLIWANYHFLFRGCNLLMYLQWSVIPIHKLFA